ncbi:uncharacterized protein MELLADRAFT_103640 [Melampsora larici-populina 98AG31]|uniref:Uncharacterized protein n=1 Tax=Melampsora larici-populina (strain 98AG31 / pathotype 3-4-7) TaxID=747676 RepID=F4RBZ8_MELLP|nr:uncharacterized protein MELLADRAFT_103640 [Melampsora larici-populina 98AG31]EGG10249.1 hypothetical protein MELLADRAFT_103640 [Melampsora larici-populina 98AG31]
MQNNIHACRSHGSGSRYTDLESGYEYDVQFPNLHSWGESYTGLTPVDEAPARLDLDTHLTVDAISDLAEAMSNDITTTIDNTDTATPDPVAATLNSPLIVADTVIPEPIAGLAGVVQPGNISLKRRRPEVLDEQVNGMKTAEDHALKRQKINLHSPDACNTNTYQLWGDEALPTEIAITINHNHTQLQDDMHRVATPAAAITSDNTSDNTHLQDDSNRFSTPAAAITSDNTSLHDDINRFFTPAAAIDSDPMAANTKAHAIKPESLSLKRQQAKVFDESSEVPVTPVPKRQKIDPFDGPAILGTPCTPVVDEQPDVPVTPVDNYQNINSSDDLMILETPRTPVFVKQPSGQPNVPMTLVYDHQKNHTSDGSITLGTTSTPVFIEQPIVPVTPVPKRQKIDPFDGPAIRTPCTPVVDEQPDMPVTPVDNYQNTNSSDDLMILETPRTPVFVKQPSGQPNGVPNDTSL